jgi:hypothetical protein
MNEDETGGNGNIFQRLASILMINRYSGGGGLGFNRAATWVAMVSAITGGYVGLSTYRLDVSKQIDQSVEKSFEMVQLYNSEDLVDARARVMSYVYAKRECDARYINRDLTDADYVRVLEFFDLAHACVEAALCDEATATRFFEPHASFQWPILKTVVEKMRSSEYASISVRSDPGFAIGMAAFADPEAQAPPCDGNF